MENLKNLFLAVIITSMFACGGIGGKNEALGSQKIDAYLSAYKDLRNSAPEFLNQANSGSADVQKQGFSDFEGIIKQHGLSYIEFIKINAKVGGIYSVLNAESFMGDMEKLKNDGMSQMDDGVKQMQEQIDNPDVPEETKVELRKSIEEIKANKKTVTEDYEKNKYWADLVLNKVKAISNQFISSEDVELVKLNFDKITEAYTGGVVPTNFNVKED